MYSERSEVYSDNRNPVTFSEILSLIENSPGNFLENFQRHQV
jgi:hypothetical protein